MRKKEHVSKNREFLVLTSKKRVLIAEFLGGFCCCMYLKFSTSSGHMKKCLLTQFGWVRQENIWILVMKHRPSKVKSICHDLEQNIFLSGPPTQSIGAYNDILNLNLKKQQMYHDQHCCSSFQSTFFIQDIGPLGFKALSL